MINDCFSIQCGESSCSSTTCPVLLMNHDPERGILRTGTELMAPRNWSQTFSALGKQNLADFIGQISYLKKKKIKKGKTKVSVFT